ncbi:MAG: periplasmic heavy metal sensor [Acidobacteriia bacterium]|nr:periplasmic heavy metal sensor [Terriglobia bacterium]
MTSKWLRRIGLAALLLALAAPVRAQSFGFPWWRDAQFQRELALTAEQRTRIDTIFQDALTKLRHQNQELTHQEDELSRMIASNADESVIVTQVDKVEGTRAHLNKTRTLMLLHERQVLTPDQRVKLNKLHEQWVKDHPPTTNTRPRGDVK